MPIETICTLWGIGHIIIMIFINMVMLFIIMEDQKLKQFDGLSLIFIAAYLMLWGTFVAWFWSSCMPTILFGAPVVGDNNITSFFAIVVLLVVLLLLYVLIFVLLYTLPSEDDGQSPKAMLYYATYIMTCFLTWRFIVPKLIELYAISI